MKNIKVLGKVCIPLILSICILMSTAIVSANAAENIVGDTLSNGYTVTVRAAYGTTLGKGTATITSGAPSTIRVYSSSNYQISGVIYKKARQNKTNLNSSLTVRVPFTTHSPIGNYTEAYFLANEMVCSHVGNYINHGSYDWNNDTVNS